MTSQGAHLACSVGCDTHDDEHGSAGKAPEGCELCQRLHCRGRSLQSTRIRHQLQLGNPPPLLW